MGVFQVEMIQQPTAAGAVATPAAGPQALLCPHPGAPLYTSAYYRPGPVPGPGQVGPGQVGPGPGHAGHAGPHVARAGHNGPRAAMHATYTNVSNYTILPQRTGTFCSEYLLRYIVEFRCYRAC